MSEMPSCEAIINELRDEALKYPHTGWLSDLARRDLTWDGQNEIIVIGAWYGSVDVGHLAAIVESLIDKKTQDLTTRLEQAEQLVQISNQVMLQQAQRANEAEYAVARVREVHCRMPVKVNFDAQPTDFCKYCYVENLDEAEYPCPTIRALDGEPYE